MQGPDLPALETHLDWIAQVSRVERCRAISITGGEPFVTFQRLLQLVEGCRNVGLRASVFTSGYWATSDDVTSDKLQQLAQAGLTDITVSTDEYHQERIPVARVARVLVAAKARGISCKIALTFVPRGSSASTVKRSIRRDLGQRALDGVEIEAGGIVKIGRARELEFPEIRLARQSKLVCNALGPVIQPDGTVTSCCRAPLPATSPLIIGDLHSEDFAVIYQRFLDHPIIPFIQAWGLIEMLERLVDEGLAYEIAHYRDAPEEQICQLCQALLSESARVSYYTELFSVPEERRRLGILTFLLYGDTTHLAS
jgi:hypothetical protein